MGLAATGRGTDANDGTTVGPGGMDSSTTFQTLAPKAPSCCVVAIGAVCGVSIATGERIDTPRLPGFSPALQVEVLPESKPANAGGQLSLHP